MISPQFKRVMLQEIKGYITKQSGVNALLHIDYSPTMLCWRITIVIPSLDKDLVCSETADIINIEDINDSEREELIQKLAEGIIKL